MRRNLILVACAILGTTILTAQASDSLQVVVDSQTAVARSSPLSSGGLATAASLGSRFIGTDSDTNAVRLVDESGRTIVSVDNAGPSGPRLGRPIQVSASSGGQVIVVDGQTPQMATFVVAGSTVSLREVVALPGLTDISGACALGQSIALLGRTIPRKESSLVQLLSTTGRSVRGIGTIFGPDAAPAKQMYGTGKIVCAPEAGLFIVASELYPEIRAYQPNGNLLWTHKIENFGMVGYKEVEKSSFLFTYPPDGVWDGLVAMARLGPSVLAVQIGRRRQSDEKQDVVMTRTLLLDIKAGRLLGTQTNLPRITAASNKQLLTTAASGQSTLLAYSVNRGAK